MNKIRRYEKEIREYDYEFSVMEDGEIKRCEPINCNNCIFSDDRECLCHQKRLEWLVKDIADDKQTNLETNLDSIIKCIRINTNDNEVHPCTPVFDCIGCMFYDKEKKRVGCQERKKQWLFGSSKLTKEDMSFLKLLDKEGKILRTADDELLYIKPVGRYDIEYKPISAFISKDSALRRIKKEQSITIKAILEGKFINE